MLTTRMGDPTSIILAMPVDPGNWWALVTNNGEPDGRPLIQTDTDPAPGFYISTTSLEDPNCDRKDPRRYVNAEAVNFIVLPGRLGLGAKLGDFAVVIRPATGTYDYSVYADVGPASKIGEGSIALAAALGLPSVQRAAALDMASFTSCSPAVPRAGHSRSRRSTSMEPSFLQSGEASIRQKIASQIWTGVRRRSPKDQR